MSKQAPRQHEGCFGYPTCNEQWVYLLASQEVFEGGGGGICKVPGGYSVGWGSKSKQRAVHVAGTR